VCAQLKKRVEGAYDLKAVPRALWERKQASAATEQLKCEPIRRVFTNFTILTVLVESQTATGIHKIP